MKDAEIVIPGFVIFTLGIIVAILFVYITFSLLKLLAEITEKNPIPSEAIIKLSKLFICLIVVIESLVALTATHLLFGIWIWNFPNPFN